MGHDLIDKRSLELNRLVAEKIRQHPELMDFVRSKIDRTLSESRLSDSCKDALREWQTKGSHEGQRLRQSAPFSGVLGRQERLDIFRHYEPTEA